MTGRINKRTFVKYMMAGAGCAALPIPAFAHRQKRALSKVEWNARTNMLEIIHDLHAHDAELVLSQLGLITSPDLTGLKARAKLALYVRKHFQLTDLDGNNIDLLIVGAETDSTYAHVYMEAELAARPSGLLITNTIFQDIMPGQINQVNVTLEKEVRPVVFVAGDGQKKVLA